MGLLQGKVAMITGGGSGIGLASARRFAREGAMVHLIGSAGRQLDAAVGELGEAHALGTPADVVDEDAVREAVRIGVERFGSYDVIFSNAGISGSVSPITEYSSEVFSQTLKVNILGAFHILKHAIPHVSDGGSIIINSSVVGLIGAPDSSAYVAAKHGQVGLMRSAAKELAPRGIRVNTLNPGPTSTQFQQDIEMASTGKAGVEAAAIFERSIPLGRHASVEEIAAAALYLASDASSFVTSTTFRVDGGFGG